MAYNPFTSPTLTGYNASPPTDDGAETANNTVEWAKHKDKLTDPIRTYADSIKTNTSSAFAVVFGGKNTQGGNYTVLTSDAGKTIAASGTSTITLLASATAGSGFRFRVQNVGTATVTIDGNASETINGATTVTLGPGQEITLLSDGSNWLGFWSMPRSNLVATAAPTVNDDTDLGYRPGSRWFDLTNDKAYDCLDATDGAAVWRLAGGVLLQRLRAETATYTSTTTTIPDDNTVPQNTEGAQLLTQAITPGNTNNILRITGVVTIAASASARTGVALFQDSTAGALNAVSTGHSGGGQEQQAVLIHEMSAGTTSETTFKLRYGPSSGTAYVNGNNVAQKYGGVQFSHLTVEEYA